MPIKLKQQLLAQVEVVTQLHEKDTRDGYSTVFLPFALEKKYPKAKFETKWQYLFPMRNLSKDPRSGKMIRFQVVANRAKSPKNSQIILLDTPILLTF